MSDDEPTAPPAQAAIEDDATERALRAEARLEEALGAYRKLRGETEGYRDRITRNVERRFEQRHEALLLTFIDILDNLDRALGAAQTSYAGAPLIDGLIMVRSQLLQTLQDEGLERIPVLGLPYDPHYSEAVGTQPVSDPDHHQVVVREMLRGYRLNGRVARPSRVLMGEYQAEAAEPASPSEPAPMPEAQPEAPKQAPPAAGAAAEASAVVADGAAAAGEDSQTAAAEPQPPAIGPVASEAGAASDPGPEEGSPSRD